MAISGILNPARPWIARRLSRAMGRAVRIHGDLSIAWRRPPAGHAAGWRAWIPLLHVCAQGVSVGDAGRAFLRARQLDAALRLLPLLRRTLDLRSAVVTGLRLDLERDRNDRPNWAAQGDGPRSRWRFHCDRLEIDHGTVCFTDAARGIGWSGDLDRAHDGGIRWELSGAYGCTPIASSGVLGVPHPARSGACYPLEAELRHGGARVRASGTWTDPLRDGALRLHLCVAGASMAQMFPLTGLALPETPPFTVDGDAVGNAAPGMLRLCYENFSGKVGASDISGTLNYLRCAPRPMLRGTVKCGCLHPRDLRAVLGIDSPEEQQQRGAPCAQPPGKRLPAERFKTERWRRSDFEVEFATQDILQPAPGALQSLFAKVSMSDGVLTLAPLSIGLAGGLLALDLRVDGRADPAVGELRLWMRDLRPGRMFAAMPAMGAAGRLGGHARLRGAGNSIASLLAHCDGRIALHMVRGAVSRRMLEEMEFDIGSLIVTRLFAEREVKLHRARAEFDASGGTMLTRSFVLDTAEAVIDVTGCINLLRETLDLTLHPRDKGRGFALPRPPLHLGGSFDAPQLRIGEGPLPALRALLARIFQQHHAAGGGTLYAASSGSAERSHHG